MKKILFLASFVLVFFTGCTTEDTAVLDSFIGDWEYATAGTIEVNSPYLSYPIYTAPQSLTGALSIKKNAAGDRLLVTADSKNPFIETKYFTESIPDLAIEANVSGNTFSASTTQAIEVYEHQFNITVQTTGTLSGDSILLNNTYSGTCEGFPGTFNGVSKTTLKRTANL